MLLLELEGHGAVCSTAGQVAACLCSGCYKGIMVVVLVLVVVVVAVVLVVVTLARVVLVILVLVVLVVLLLMSIVVLLNAILLLSLHFVLKITFFPPPSTVLTQFLILPAFQLTFIFYFQRRVLIDFSVC